MTTPIWRSTVSKPFEPVDAVLYHLRRAIPPGRDAGQAGRHRFQDNPAARIIERRVHEYVTRMVKLEHALARACEDNVSVHSESADKAMPPARVTVPDH